MKSRFGLTYMFRSAFLALQFILCVPLSAAILMDSMEIEERVVLIAEKIDETAKAILSIAPEGHTFENTLKLWNQLSTELLQELDALNSVDTMMTSQLSDYLQSYFMEVVQDPELSQILMDCSYKVAQNMEIDPFQRYVGSRLIENGSEPVYFNGIAEEKNDVETVSNLLNFKSEAQVSQLAYKILSANADAVCIHDIVADHHAYALYNTLKKNYAHFIYVPARSIFNFANSNQKKGMLIASKFNEDEFGIFLAHSRRDSNDDRGGASCQIGIDAAWGDGKGIQWEAYFSGEIHDNKGNYLEGEVTQRDNGSGRFDIHGGHESNHESRNE
jgi:hypothetical protein